jgi:hypothetical protein
MQQHFWEATMRARGIGAIAGLTVAVAVALAVSGAAAAADAAANAAADAADGLVRGRTTVADVERGLGAPMDTTMRPDGALTLVYTYGRCAGRLPAAFPSVHGSDANGRVVSLHFGTDFHYRGASVVSLTSAAAGELPAHTNLASK